MLPLFVCLDRIQDVLIEALSLGFGCGLDNGLLPLRHPDPDVLDLLLEILLCGSLLGFGVSAFLICHLGHSFFERLSSILRVYYIINQSMFP